jgi:CDP-glucose 4,6-dehydratase
MGEIGQACLPTRTFYAGKRVLVTGHTGFKGGWLVIWLKVLGAEVSGISLKPNTAPNLFEAAGVAQGIDSRICDIRDLEKVSGIIREVNPDIVFHLAAQPLVRASYDEPIVTFETNVMGTAHILESIRTLKKRTIAVIITTDKVYENREWPYPYRETDALGGHDPYSASKAAAEIVSAAYRSAFLRQLGMHMATARAGNVIGGGDWSADRLLPDAVRAWSEGRELHVRRPDALRPWQHVLDALAGYLVLAERLSVDESVSEAWNFGPATQEAATVRTVVEHARKAFGRGTVQWATDMEGPHEAGLLMLEPTKARRRLGVVPRWDLAEAVSRTMKFYRSALDGAPQRELCLREIADYGVPE